mmetsp:Transcript_33438/g.75796  ORF Transcript_33438/g.75796 Transcript_33438/m.75796 type:complete len:204 (-) Transcript_33438:18-629(-)
MGIALAIGQRGIPVDLEHMPTFHFSHGHVCTAAVCHTHNLCEGVAVFQVGGVLCPNHVVCQLLSQDQVTLTGLQHGVETTGLRCLRGAIEQHSLNVLHNLDDLIGLGYGTPRLLLLVFGLRRIRGKDDTHFLSAVEILRGAHLQAANAVDAELRAILSALVEDRVAGLHKLRGLRLVVVARVQGTWRWPFRGAAVGDAHRGPP